MKVEIGPGPEPLGEDWTGVSSVPGPAVDLLCEWGLDDLPFLSGTVDEIYASHVIEHVGWMNVTSALAEAWRVLRRGGLIELHTIDFAVVSKEMMAAPGDIETWNRANLKVMSYAKRSGDRACFQWHHSMFVAESLRALLVACGFSQIESVAEPRGPEKHGVYNLGVKAVKA